MLELLALPAGLLEVEALANRCLKLTAAEGDPGAEDQGEDREQEREEEVAAETSTSIRSSDEGKRGAAELGELGHGGLLRIS